MREGAKGEAPEAGIPGGAPASPRMGAFSRLEMAVFGFYAAVVAFMTWPAVTLFGATYAQRGDPMGVLWWLWWFRFASARRLPWSPVTWVGVPFGRNISPLSRDPLTTLSLRAGSIASTETVAYNVFLLLAFFFAAVAMYYLVRKLTVSRGAAAVAGFAFAFCPYMLMHAKEHIGLVSTGFIPLVFYFLVRAWKERSVLMAVLLAASFVLMTLFNYHYGLIGAVMLVTFSLAVWLMGKPWKADSGRVFLRMLPLLLCIAGAAVLLAVVFVRRNAAPGDMTGMYLYSARPWDYFLPHAESAALGWMTRGFITSHLHGGFLVESSLFLGVVTIAFAAYGLYGLYRENRAARSGAARTVDVARRCAPEERCREAETFQGARSVPETSWVSGRGPGTQDDRIPLGFAACAVVCFLCSLPPTVTLWGLKVYLPSYLLHYLVPDVRAYSRFGLGVLFSLVVIASYGVARLLRRGRFSKHRALTVAGIGLLVLLEFTIVPPFRSLDTAATAEHYRWLESRPPGTVVAIYPFFYADDFANYNYFFDQRHHRKKMVNGGEPGAEGEKIRQIALSLYSPAAPGILRKLTADYVLVIPSLYRQGNHVNYIKPAVFEPSRVAPGLEPLKKFGDCVVYRVAAPPAMVLPLFEAGAYQPVVYPDGSVWHPGAREVVVDIRSEHPRPVTADIAFQAAAVAEEGAIRFELNGAGSRRSPLKIWPTGFAMKAVTLLPGSNRLTIHSESALAPVTEIPGSTEVQAAVMVSDVQVETRP